MELKDTGGLSEDILNSFEGYLAQAKLLEAETDTVPKLQEKVASLEEERDSLLEMVNSLETQVTDAQLALCDVYELALGGGV